MNVGIGNKAAQFYFWKYINRILDTVHLLCYNPQPLPLSVCCLAPQPHSDNFGNFLRRLASALASVFFYATDCVFSRFFGVVATVVGMQDRNGTQMRSEGERIYPF
jgi:hypothetical protein